MSKKFSQFSDWGVPGENARFVGYDPDLEVDEEFPTQNVQVSLSDLLARAGLAFTYEDDQFKLVQLGNNGGSNRINFDFKTDSNAVQISVGEDTSSPIMILQSGIVRMRGPVSARTKNVNDALTPCMMPSDSPVVIYTRTDAEDLDWPSWLFFDGADYEIFNASGAAFDITCTDPGTFYDGATGVVNGLTVAAGETIRLRDVGGVHRIVSRYV